MRHRTWAQQVAAVARYDRIKLCFPDVHPIHRQHVDEVIQFALAKLQAENPAIRLHLPKATVLDPSPNKPNGKYIIELNGYVAELCRFLPAGWLTYVTYADVKSFVRLRNERSHDDLQAILETPGGYRNVFISHRKRGNQSGTKMPGRAYTLGSGKSGMHLNCYRRPSQPTGIEGKFRDEQVHNVTATAWDIFNQGEATDEQAWILARNMWGLKMAEGWAGELYSRAYEPAEVFHPVTYEAWKETSEGRSVVPFVELAGDGSRPDGE